MSTRTFHEKTKQRITRTHFYSPKCSILKLSIYKSDISEKFILRKYYFKSTQIPSCCRDGCHCVSAFKAIITDKAMLSCKRTANFLKQKDRFNRLRNSVLNLSRSQTQNGRLCKIVLRRN